MEDGEVTERYWVVMIYMTQLVDLCIRDLLYVNRQITETSTFPCLRRLATVIIAHIQY